MHPGACLSIGYLCHVSLAALRVADGQLRSLCTLRMAPAGQGNLRGRALCHLMQACCVQVRAAIVPRPKHTSSVSPAPGQSERLPGHSPADAFFDAEGLSMPQHQDPRYKTQMCVYQMHLAQGCGRGSACTFAHSETEMMQAHARVSLHFHVFGNAWPSGASVSADVWHVLQGMHGVAFDSLVLMVLAGHLTCTPATRLHSTDAH